MIDVSAQLIGGEELLAALAALPTLLMGRANVAMKTSVEAGLWRMQQLTPVAVIKGGRLRKGDAVAVVSTTALLIEYALYNPVPYAIYVCFGTRKMRARDFLTPAVEYGRSELERRLAGLL